MKKLLAFALVAGGAITASCSGQQYGGAVPQAAAPTVAQTQSDGAQSARAQTIAPAPQGWAKTTTGALAFVHSTDLGVSPRNQPVTVHVGLQLRNLPQLKAAIAHGAVMSRSEFVSRYAPTQDQVSRVEAYLREQGFTGVTHQPNNLIVDARGTADRASKAFSTTIHSVSLNGRQFYANVRPAYVPASLDKVVVAVMGLSNVPLAKPAPAKLTAHHELAPAIKTAAASPSPEPCTVNEEGVCARFYNPASFQIAYDAANAPTGARTNVAIMTEGELSTAIADFRTNEQQFNLPQVPISIVQVEPPSTDTSGNSEWTLDMTYSTGMAGNVKNLYLYNVASLSDSDIVVAYNKWVSDDKAPIGNSSFGGCEVFPYTDGSMVMGDEVLVEAAAQGQTMFVSSGDNGGYCNNFVDTNGAPGGIPMVEWPAASPYVVAVGGTDLFSNPDGTYSGETAWEAGGGGLSQFEYGPSWETGVQPVSSTPAGFTFRGVPDIAMDASLETGALLYTSASAVNGSCTPCTTGGTSLASPLAAGSYARMQSAHGNKLGFGAIALYNIYNANPSASETSAGPPPWQLVGGFHDILAGTNGLYTALPRYDYTTGLGSFDITKTNAVIGQ